jgi:hypothetical protein
VIEQEERFECVCLPQYIQFTIRAYFNIAGMKYFFVTLILILIFQYSLCQKPSPDLSILSLKEIFSQAVKIDTLCLKNRLLIINEDGDSSDCTSYYKNEDMCLKVDCNEYSSIGTFNTISYPQLKNSSSLTVISFFKDSFQAFKMYLIEVKSETYELIVFGNRNDFAGEIGKIKARIKKEKN